MTGFLVLIVLVLISVAIWQLVKIFDLTQIGVKPEDNLQIATDNDNKVNGYLMFAFLGFIYVFMLFSMIKWGPVVLGKPASLHGPEYDNLMTISMVLIFTVQIITQALLHYFAFKYTGKQGQKAVYFADNNKLELIWSSIPAIVLAVLIFYGLYNWSDIMFFDEKNGELNFSDICQKYFFITFYGNKNNTRIGLQEWYDRELQRISTQKGFDHRFKLHDILANKLVMQK